MTRTLHRALLNKYALGTALALVIAPLAGIESAEAACTPATSTGSPVENNQNVSCTGTTTDQNANGIGWGTAQEAGNSITVTSGATVTGTNTGFNLNRGNTLTNAGTISGGNLGIVGLENTILHNSGSISANAVAVGLGDTTHGVTTIDNSGSITATGGGSTALSVQGKLNLTPNAGAISGVAFGISADNATIANGSNGVITATGNNGVAIGRNSGAVADVVTLDNAGSVLATNIGGIAVQGVTVSVNSNTGAISGDAFGINATGTATVKNGVGGTISAAAANGIAIGDNAQPHTSTVTLDNAGTVQALGAGGVAIQARTVNVNSNTGDIVGDATAIFASDTANVTNSKNITAIGGIIGDGDAIFARTVNVNNLAGGVITGGDNGGGGITAAGDLVLNNSGKITAAFAVTAHDSATITNSGEITGRSAIFTDQLTLTNSGTITGTSFDAVSVSGDANIVNLAGGTIQGKIFGINTNTLTLVNSGMISGRTAISASGAAVITNFGSIQSTAGATGTAIQLSSAADTLNVKRGSSIVGLIDFGHGADVINVDSSAPQTPKGVSMLSRATSVVVDALRQQLVNFDGIINIIGGNSTSGQPSVTVNGTTASLDPTALAQQDRTLMDFTGGMSSTVQGRLAGSAGGSGPTAMSYAMEDARAEIFSKAPAATWNAPVTVWTSGFGGVRSQNGTDTTLDSRSSVAGGAIGVDRRIRPDWLVGVFAGGGAGTLNVDLGSQKIDTDYFAGGAYSRFEWASQFVDATLQVGGINNRSSRLLQNNVTGGLEHASASYNGWFISPEIAYGYHVNLGNGAVLTPLARVRYVAGFFDGYNETGSAQTLSIGSRTLQDFEERGELEYARTGFGGDPNLKLTVHGGVIAWQRTGNATINALLIGSGLSFVTPGRSSAVGGVAGAGLDYHVGPNVALFGAVEGTVMSDESRVVSAKGGMRVAF